VSSSDVAGLSLVEVAGLLRRREVSPVAVTAEVLDRIDRLDPVLGSFVTVMAEEAVAAAKVAEAEIGRGLYRGPLHGVPVSLKDLIFVKGVRNTAGSAALADFVPGYDAAVTERLREAGAIVVGKAQTYEFAMGPGTAYPFGRTRNPWNLDRVTIGSSSGSAAAVSARLAYASIGTDAGGSIRRPASGCGVVGFKPSAGRVSKFGSLPLSWTLDHVGPLAREVMDAAWVTHAIEGFDRRDPSSVLMEPLDLERIAVAEVAGLRIGIPGEFFFAGVDPQFRAAFDRAVAVFVEAGATRHPVELHGIEHAQTAHSVIVLGESYSIHEELFLKRRELFGENARNRMTLASTLLARDYLRAQRVRAVFRDQYRKAIADVDILLTLTAPVIPHLFDQPPAHAHGKHASGADNRLTRMYNLVGAPAVSIPCGFTAEGMPIGLQIAGRPGDDDTVLAAAHAYEQRTRWHTMHPPVVGEIATA
jgi:aspartyl-tRNA(Asn)/glutamyl-tRNA(Gln) amidotransferase subunit A